MNFHRKVMMVFILARDFDFIAYMSEMAFFWEAFFTPMAFLEYDMCFVLGDRCLGFNCSEQLIERTTSMTDDVVAVVVMMVMMVVMIIITKTTFYCSL